jgi:hypothetical protein
MRTLRDLFTSINAAALRLGAKSPPRPSAMIGTPTSQQPLWDDPAAHAKDFAER